MLIGQVAFQSIVFLLIGSSSETYFATFENARRLIFRADRN